MAEHHGQYWYGWYVVLLPVVFVIGYFGQRWINRHGRRKSR
jgi:hypothetical protein